jgi:hypothetical protein
MQCNKVNIPLPKEMNGATKRKDGTKARPKTIITNVKSRACGGRIHFQRL